MPDLIQARFHEEQKLAEALLARRPSSVQAITYDLANCGIPLHGAAWIAALVSKLEDRIAALEKSTPPHLKKLERR